MDILKKYFPFSFGSKDVASLIIKVVIYVAALIVGAAVLGLVGALVSIITLGFLAGLVGFIGFVVGGLFELYVVVGIVLTFLDYFKILK